MAYSAPTGAELRSPRPEHRVSEITAVCCTVVTSSGNDMKQLLLPLIRGWYSMPCCGAEWKFCFIVCDFTVEVVISPTARRVY